MLKTTILLEKLTSERLKITKDKADRFGVSDGEKLVRKLGISRDQNLSES